MNTAHPINDENAELRRLLQRAIDLAQEAAAADFDWWNSQIDNLLICMMPLWEKCGIRSPGIWIDDGRFRADEPPSRMLWLLTRDPDTGAENGTLLEARFDDGRSDAPARAVEELMVVAEAWIGWLEGRSARSEVRALTDDDKAQDPAEISTEIKSAGRKKNRSPNEIKIAAQGQITQKARKGECFRSLRELASAVGCSPSGQAIKEVWDFYSKKLGKDKTPQAEALHDGIGEDDESLQRLIKDQAAEMRAIGKPRRPSV